MKLPSSSSNTSARNSNSKGQESNADNGSRRTAGESKDEVVIMQHAQDGDGLPPIPVDHRASTSRHARSTPPTHHHRPQQQRETHQHTEHRKSLIRTASRTSLKRALSPSTTTTTRQAEEEHTNKIDTLVDIPTAVEDTAPSTQRRRRKSFKEIFTLPSSKISTQATSRSADPTHKSDTVSTSNPAQSRRRYSFASPSSSSSSAPASPTSPAILRKSTSTSAFTRQQNRENIEKMYIPPVPALPAHISLSPILPISPSSSSIKGPQTPTSASSSSMRIPQSAKSTSSFMPSTPSTASSTDISRSSSVPTLHTSVASTASPSSSTGTLATPQTIDLRSPPASSHYNDTEQQPRQGSESKNDKRIEHIPLLLGPCLSDTLLSSDTLHTAEILKALHEKQASFSNNDVGVMEEIKSEDEYGSDDGAVAESARSDKYGAASNMSHGDEIGIMASVQTSEDITVDVPQNGETRMKMRSKSLSRANSGSLRVDTSLASLSSSPLNNITTNKRSSTYFSSNNSPSSLSPYSQSFPTSPMYRSNEYPRSASSTSINRNTPTPTQMAVPSPSPRALSQGAKICLEYTILRLRKDGSNSSSIQPEKVNMLQYGGRRYPSSTRRLPPSPLHISSSSSSHGENRNQVEQERQRRKEPKAVNMQKELAWIDIIHKLQSRKRLTLLEEVELDEFKKIKNVWTPCSSPLTFDFSFSSSTNAINNANVHANVSGVPPLGTISKNSALRDHGTARELLNDQAIAQPTLSRSASHSTAFASSLSPSSSTNTSALVFGSFLKAQQITWLKWISRGPFELRMKVILQDGESFHVVREVKGQLIISDRVHAWASATLGDVEASQSMQVGTLNGKDTFELVKTAAIQNVAIPQPQLAVPLSKDNVPNVNIKSTTIANSILNIESLPFSRNHAAILETRPSSSNEAGTSKYKSEASDSSENSLFAITTKPNQKSSFGRTLAAKFGFKMGKNKVSPVVPTEQERSVQTQPRATTEKLQESSSASSFANTTTPNSTPSTSASSTCSDQLDANTIVSQVSDASMKPVRPGRSALRPSREQRPISMVRSASQGDSLMHGPKRTSMFLDNQSTKGNDCQPPTHSSDKSLPVRPRSMMPKSHSEQQIHGYHPRGVSLEAPQRTSVIIDPNSTPPVPQRRVRVPSQPEAVLAPRPHSMYTQPQSRQDRPHNEPGPRPTSQLLQVPRPKSLAVPGALALQSGHSHSDPQVRTMTSSQTRLDIQQPTTSLRHADDDETPLAVLRQNSSTPTSSGQSSRQNTPEPRPCLRSAMRSTSQPRPISTISSSNRNSTISFHERGGSPRSASPASSRLSVHDPPSPRNGRDSWIKSEDTLKSLIREEQLKEEHEAEEIARRREQRKVWEDHRRRSVYLEDQAAAAEKAATEAQRRQSRLYMSMALASAHPHPHPQPQLNHGQPVPWTNGMQHSPYAGIQQSQYFPPQLLHSARTPMPQRPISYHHDQNRNSPPIAYGQPIPAFQR